MAYSVEILQTRAAKSRALQSQLNERIKQTTFTGARSQNICNEERRYLLSIRCAIMG